MIKSNIGSVKAGMNKAILEIDARTIMARDEMMARLIQLSKEEIKGRRPAGERATPDAPPMNRTGNLRRSIKGQKFKEGFGSYSGVVGPTMVYARRVELGGGNWPSGLKFPYMKPAYDKFIQRGEMTAIFTKHLGG